MNFQGELHRSPYSLLNFANSLFSISWIMVKKFLTFSLLVDYLNSLT